MALNSWQKLTRVIPGKPFGDGADGAYSSATVPTMLKDSCSGTATSTTLTTSGSTFANGDVLKVIQMRGTGVGQWEIVKVLSGGGSTSLTLSTALQYTYTDSGASQAQAVKIFRYTDVTVQSGTWTPSAWDGNVGGVLTFACNGTLTPTGTINTGSLGFVGGTGGLYSSFTQAYAGEGSAAASAIQQTANGNGGGGNYSAVNWAGGGGGGGANGANGSAGTTGGSGANQTPGAAGVAAGGTGLDTITLGGGGGGGGGDSSSGDGLGTGGTGGRGGGIISIFAKTILSPTSITSTGSAGTTGTTYQSSNPHHGAGGGGAGGSILICGGTINIGTDKITTIGGNGGTPAIDGGIGGVGAKGRIAVYYGTSLTGSVSSTYYGTLTSAQDTSLKEVAGGMWLMF